MSLSDMNNNQSYVFSSESGERHGFFKRRTGKILVVLIIILVIIAVVANLIKPSSPESVANSFTGYVLDNKTDQAYLLTSSSFRITATRSQLQKVIESVDSSCSGSQTLKSQKLYSSSASYIFTANGTNSSTCHLLVGLSKTSNKWYVDFFDEY